MIQSIAKTVRLHYLDQLNEELRTVKHKLTRLTTKNGHGIPCHWNLRTDCDLNGIAKTVRYKDIQQGHSNQKNKMYRHDIVLFKNAKPMKPYMCWPVRLSDYEPFLEEDIPWFPVYNETIYDTRIEINPFPWYACTVLFYPDAQNIQGILDLWFRNWFYPKRRSKPFLNVVHRIDGPYQEKEGGETYHVDFGTAPEEAFCDLIANICRNGVSRVVVR
jgi:hypothetical protein